MFKELRADLFMHYEIDPNILAKELIISATKNAANSLNLNNGEIAPNKDADLIAIKLPTTKSNIHLHTILDTNEVEKMFINGEEV
jgi:imidazolonepropionase-like amidohydrolase